MQTSIETATDPHEPQYDQGDDRYVLQHDPDGSATLTATLVHALSSVADADVSQGEFSLYDSVDPEALERIFATKADGTRREGGHVAFTALEHEIYVYATGDVFIYPPSPVSQEGDGPTDRR